jgi:hypothetical protein
LTYFPGLPQSVGAAGYSNTTALITKHITRADTIINGKIAARYAIGSIQTNVPPLLRTLSEDIASYFSFRSWFSQDNQNVNEWTDKFNEATQMLDMIRKGEMDLFDTAGSLITEVTTDDMQMVDGNNIDYQSFFDEDNELSWKVDEDKLDAIGDER